MRDSKNTKIAGIVIVFIASFVFAGCRTMPKMKDAPIKIHRVTEINGVKQFIDIRGAGGSFLEEVPPENTMNVDQFIEDTIAVMDLMSDEFGKAKIYIIGHSWGSKLALLTVDRYPEKYLAYIGIGFSVNLSNSEPHNYQLVYKWAGEDGNETAIEQLESISIPPYTTYDFNDAEKMGVHRMWAMYYGGGPVNLARKDIEGTMALLHTALVECAGYQHFNYDMTIEKFYAGQFTMPASFFVETNNLNLDELKEKVEVPVYILHGVDDAQTSYQVSKEYFKTLQAPNKKFFTFEHSSHSPPFEEPEKFYAVMEEIIASVEW